MNISFNTQSPYSSYFQKAPLVGQGTRNKSAGSALPFMPGNSDAASPLSKFTDKMTDDKPSISQQMRQMIRDLKAQKKDCVRFGGCGRTPDCPFPCKAHGNGSQEKEAPP